MWKACAMRVNCAAKEKTRNAPNYLFEMNRGLQAVND